MSRTYIVTYVDDAFPQQRWVVQIRANNNEHARDKFIDMFFRNPNSTYSIVSIR